MSLTVNDLVEIRTIFKEEITPLEGRLEAMENDVKEIYSLLSQLMSISAIDKKFKKLTLEDKLFKLNTELLAAAKQAGISLPR